jgi:predicted Zn-dependent protease
MRSVSIIAVLAALSLVGCATSTAPGAIGVSRSQLMIMPSAVINAKAAEGYMQLSSTANASGRLNKDPTLTARVRAIAAKLIPHVAVYRADAVSWPWEVNVFESEQLNAFCMPGGKIGFMSGIITKLELTDAEIAAIMGHEIAHALREHSREKVSQAVLSNAVVQAVASSGSRNAGVHGALADVGAKLFFTLPFSRDMELEADAMGLELMARGGYDPKLAPGVWRKMQAHSGGQAEFFSTHPNHDRRIAEIEAALAKVVPLYASAHASPDRAVAALPVASLPATPGVAAAPHAETVHVASTLVQARDQAAKERALDAKIGKDSFQVERIARERSCHPQPFGVLTSKATGVETYEVTCTNGSLLKFRCEFGNCVVAKQD